MPCARLERMGEWTPVDKRHLPFSGRVGLSHFEGPGLMPALYLLLGFLSIPSFLTSLFGTLDFHSLIVQSGHHSFQPFFTPDIEYGIDDGSLVLRSPWF